MNGKAAEGELIMDIDSAINTEKTIEIERRKYMTYEMKMQEFRQEGYDDGVEAGRIQSAKEFIASGILSFDDIKATGRYTEEERAAIRQ